MFKKFLGQFSKDMGIDLGTANTLVYVKDQGIVINEPSVVAINTRTDKIVAVGDDAKVMLGKTPLHINVIRPLVDGVISDFEVSEKMIKHFINKVHKESMTFMPRPRVMIAIPLDITEVERKAVEDAVMGAGASEVLLIEEPIAAAIGAGLPILEATASMIVDMGGGTTEIAVISLGGVVSWKSLKLAGDKLNEAIIQYARDKFNILLGERTAEKIKIQIIDQHKILGPKEKEYGTACPIKCVKNIVGKEGFIYVIEGDGIFNMEKEEINSRLIIQS